MEKHDIFTRGEVVLSLRSQFPQHGSTLKMFILLHEQGTEVMINAFHRVLEDPCSVEIPGEEKADKCASFGALRKSLVRTTPGEADRPLSKLDHQFLDLLQASRTTALSGKVNPSCRPTELSRAYVKKYEKHKEKKPPYATIAKASDATLAGVAGAIGLLHGVSMYRRNAGKKKNNLDIRRTRRIMQMQRGHRK